MHTALTQDNLSPETLKSILKQIKPSRSHISVADYKRLRFLAPRVNLACPEAKDWALGIVARATATSH